MKIVVDTHAWIEYLKGSETGSKVRQIVESEENELFSSIITVSEVSSVFKRENRDVEQACVSIIDLSKIYFINLEFAKEAGILHAETRKKIKDFCMADSIILLTARKLGAKILTGDPHFKGFKEAVLI